METLIITAKDITRVLTPAVANRIVEKAFKAYGSGKADMPPKSYLYFKNGDLRAMPAYIYGQGLDIAGVKSVNVHSQNRRFNLPTVMGIIVLTDPQNGFPIAVLDGTSLTGIRTGAAGALAVGLLSRRKSRIAGFVGTGSQARAQLACIMEVRKLTFLKVWRRSRKSPSAERFCKWAEETFGLDTGIYDGIDDVTMDTDILVTTTPSRIPLVERVSPGSHINAIGADARGKQEIHEKILKRAKIIIDDWRQASHSGEINVPFKKGQLRKKDIYGELGQIAVNKKDGRTSEEEITLFDSTGLAIQDVSCGYVVYRAVKDNNRIKRVAFFTQRSR